MKGRICILGGTGFLGRELLALLHRSGYSIDVLTRRPHRYRELAVLPSVHLLQCDILSRARLSTCIRGADIVINLVGTFHESAPGEFQQLHVQLPRLLTEVAKECRVSRLIHLSALNADSGSGNPFLRSKGQGELFVHNESGPRMAVTSLRPSLMFGPRDRMITRFRQMLENSAGVIPTTQGDYRLAPVYVGDVAATVVSVLNDADLSGKHMDLSGPDDYSVRELFAYIAETSGYKPRLLTLPERLAPLQRFWIGELPGEALFEPLPVRRPAQHSRVKAVCATRLENIAPGILQPASGLLH